MKSIISLCSALCIGATLFAPAALAGNTGQGTMHMAMQAQGDADQLSTGAVKRVNAEAGWITLAHGPLTNLGMPPMTMTFGVKDKALLKGIKAGDKVRFHAEQAGDGLIVTQLKAAH